MTSYALSNEVGPEICDILGIDYKHVTAMTVEIAAYEPMVVVVTRLVCEEEAAGMVEVIERYKLITSDEAVLDG